jgi:hypothetical protein
MCRLLAVSRSDDYEWRHRSPSVHADASQQLRDNVACCVAQGRGTYGTRRITSLLATEGLVGSRRRIGRVLT